MQLAVALGQLWAAGIGLDAAPLFEGRGASLITLPPTPLDTQPYWPVERPRTPAAPMRLPSAAQEMTEMDPLVALFREQVALLQQQAKVLEQQAAALAGKGVSLAQLPVVPPAASAIAPVPAPALPQVARAVAQPHAPIAPVLSPILGEMASEGRELKPFAPAFVESALAATAGDPLPRRLLLTRDSLGVADALAKLLNDAGHDAVLGEPGDPLAGIGGVIHLAPLGRAGSELEPGFG